jgi:hypothetical protein
MLCRKADVASLPRAVPHRACTAALLTWALLASLAALHFRHSGPAPPCCPTLRGWMGQDAPDVEVVLAHFNENVTWLQPLVDELGGHAALTVYSKGKGTDPPPGVVARRPCTRATLPPTLPHASAHTRSPSSPWNCASRLWFLHLGLQVPSSCQTWAGRGTRTCTTCTPATTRWHASPSSSWGRQGTASELARLATARNGWLLQGLGLGGACCPLPRPSAPHGSAHATRRPRMHSPAGTRLRSLQNCGGTGSRRSSLVSSAPALTLPRQNLATPSAGEHEACCTRRSLPGAPSSLHPAPLPRVRRYAGGRAPPRSAPGPG